MKLERLVASLELCKELKELGVRQDSQFYWVRPADYNYWILITHEEAHKNLAPGTNISWMIETDTYSAFTSGELGVALPKDAGIEFELSQENGWTISGYDINRGSVYFVSDETEADARAKMLIHLLKNKMITVEEVNERLSK